MKNKALTSFLQLTLVLLSALFVVTSCEKDDPKPPILIEDGFYVKGDLTPYSDLEFNASFVPGMDEVSKEERTGMYEKYTTLKAGSAGFNIYQVAGKVTTKWGPATVEVIDLAGANDQPNITIQKGTLGTSGVFTVPADGLYHIIIDIQTNTFIIAPVPHWAILGGATAAGWSDTPMPLIGTFNINEVQFEITGLELRKGNFKFRYGGGWKIEIDGELVKANSNFGGTVSGTLPNLTTELIPGGPDYNFLEANEGLYTVNLTWKAEGGFTSSLAKTADVDPLPEWPEAMYIVGGATAYDWDAPGTHPNAIMHKIAGGVSNEGIFWKICHLTGGAGFKLAADNWGDPNIGFDQVNEFDADGVTVTSADGNLSVAESGMYIVVLNLRDEQIKVSVKPAVVYGIGDAFGSWDSGVAASLFTVDNVEKTLISPALTANDNIRMYAAHAWIPDWWQAEFNVFSGVIEYRNDGGDQDVVAGTAGQIITLHFDDNTGSIQ